VAQAEISDGLREGPWGYAVECNANGLVDADTASTDTHASHSKSVRCSQERLKAILAHSALFPCVWSLLR
jgi:hypothetical protein